MDRLINEIRTSEPVVPAALRRKCTAPLLRGDQA